MTKDVAFQVDLNDQDCYRTKGSNKTFTITTTQSVLPFADSTMISDYAPSTNDGGVNAAIAAGSNSPRSTSTFDRIFNRNHHQHVDFSFTKAAKAKITSWLVKNMSLRRNREVPPTSSSVNKKASFRVEHKPVVNEKQIERVIDFESLSVSVEFSDDDLENADSRLPRKSLVLTKNEFNLHPKRPVS